MNCHNCNFPPNLVNNIAFNLSYLSIRCTLYLAFSTCDCDVTRAKKKTTKAKKTSRTMKWNKTQNLCRLSIYLNKNSTCFCIRRKLLCLHVDVCHVCQVNFSQKFPRSSLLPSFFLLCVSVFKRIRDNGSAEPVNEDWMCVFLFWNLYYS